MRYNHSQWSDHDGNPAELPDFVAEPSAVELDQTTPETDAEADEREQEAAGKSTRAKDPRAAKGKQ